MISITAEAMKITVAIVVICLIGAAFGDLSYYELRRLYNSRVTHAEYYERPLSSGSSSSSSWWSRGKRAVWDLQWDYDLVHAGVLVFTEYNGFTIWLIHKGSDYGDTPDSPSTVITEARHMSSRWTRKKCGDPIHSSTTVNQFMNAAHIHTRYQLLALTGANCQTAARGMWDLIDEDNTRCRYIWLK